MLLHIGGDISVFKKDIVAIFDINSSSSGITAEFLEIAKSERIISEITNQEKSKSIILLANKIYLSPISSTTLQKRADNNNDIVNILK
ncbi:MAG: DUF370 domain-containing protein [Firmicutes bacterium HGW-Firmicutes-12]|nr:MAG: DUF370 domain-containing protein [Firmicutes bacterium HGW-Firmicutes-12]